MRMKSRLKDILLVSLVFFTLILSFQIWFGSGYAPRSGSLSIGAQLRERIAEPVLKWLGKGGAGTFSQNIKDLMLPKKIVLNLADKRAVLYSNDEAYHGVLRAADELIEALITGKADIKSKETVSLDDYCSVLKGKSVYLDYGTAMDFRLFSVNICGTEKNVLGSDLTTIRECIVSLEDNVLNNAAIYMKDYKSGNVMRYSIDKSKSGLDEVLNSYFKANTPETTLSYSYELNFHKQESGDGALTKLVFDPMILFNLIPSEGAVLESEGDAAHNPEETDSAHINGILRAFQINPMTMNKYTDLTNANIFVENDATLRISPEGYFVYQAVEGGQGLPLVDTKGKGSMDIYATVSAAVGFVSALSEEVPDVDISDLRFCSDLTENGVQGSYTIEFDLYVGGLPVLQLNPSDGERCHAITMVIENGCLKQYRQFVRKYRVLQKTEQITPIISAVDGLMDELNPHEEYLTINDAKKCYLDTRMESMLSPLWEISVEGVDTILTVR